MYTYKTAFTFDLKVYGETPGVPGAPEPRMYPRSGYFLVYVYGYVIGAQIELGMREIMAHESCSGKRCLLNARNGSAAELAANE